MTGSAFFGFFVLFCWFFSAKLCQQHCIDVLFFFSPIVVLVKALMGLFGCYGLCHLCRHVSYTRVSYTRVWPAQPNLQPQKITFGHLKPTHSRNVCKSKAVLLGDLEGLGGATWYLFRAHSPSPAPLEPGGPGLGGGSPAAPCQLLSGCRLRADRVRSSLGLLVSGQSLNSV